MAVRLSLSCHCNCLRRLSLNMVLRMTAERLCMQGEDNGVRDPTSNSNFVLLLSGGHHLRPRRGRVHSGMVSG